MIHLKNVNIEIKLLHNNYIQVKRTKYIFQLGFLVHSSESINYKHV